MFISNALYNGVKAIFAFSSAKIDHHLKTSFLELLQYFVIVCLF